MPAPVFNPDAKVVGERIAHLRAIREYSQKQLGEYVGKSRSAIAQWENGHAFPSNREYVELAGILGSTPQFIAFGVEKDTDDMIVVPVVSYDKKRHRPDQIASVALDPFFVKRLLLPTSSNLKAVSLDRDSGAIQLKGGDRLIVDTANTQIDGVGESILIWDNGPVMAQAASIPGSENMLITIGPNSFQLDPSNVEVLGRIVAYVGRMQ